MSSRVEVLALGRSSFMPKPGCIAWHDCFRTRIPYKALDLFVNFGRECVTRARTERVRTTGRKHDE